MRGILIRLFIKIPLYTLWFLVLLTIVIPILFWVLTDKNWIDLGEDIDWID